MRKSMKKYAIILFLVFLTACAKTENGAPVVSSESADNVDLEVPENSATFQAVVLEANENMLLVEPVEGSPERASSDQICVANEEKLKLAPGDMIEIEYDGNMMESYPAQLGNVYRIGILKETENPDQKGREQEVLNQKAQEQEVPDQKGQEQEVLNQKAQGQEVPDQKKTDSSSGQEISGAGEARPRKIASLSLVDAMLPRYPAFGSLEEVSVRSGAAVEVQAGTYGGSPAEWCAVEDDGFMYFYYRFTGETDGETGTGSGAGMVADSIAGSGAGMVADSVAGSGAGTGGDSGTGADGASDVDPGTSPGVGADSGGWEYSNYAVTGEDLGLACGIHPGMTRAQAEELVPDLYVYRWNRQESPWVYDWNPGTYPNGWCEQFPAILVAQVENEADTPYCVGFMLDEGDVIRAISFCWVTGG